MPSPRFRFEFMVLPDDNPTELTSTDFTHHLMSAWIDPADVRVERSAVYTFHGLIARQWRKGRVLLAGDAAHQMPPFLGQGMCSGLRDAMNLAWKLDRVITAEAGPELLDTYQAEREPHVRQIVESAVGFGRLICTTDPEVAAARDRDLLAARAAGGGDIVDAAGPALPVGPLVSGNGRPALQPLVGPQRLDDVVGQRFAVLTRSITAPGPGWDLLEPLVLDAASTPAVASVLDALGVDMAVLRPDRYVLWTGTPGTSMPNDVRALLSR
jgi:3-(3-hydroxy-phenyl)propionate hydroxylase